MMSARPADARQTAGSLTLPNRPGGYTKLPCVSCSAFVWRKEDIDGDIMCGWCKQGHAVQQCGICLEPSCVFFPMLPNQSQMICATHPFCVSCMGTYVTFKIEEGAGDICCPDPGCQVRFGETLIKKLACRGSVTSSTLRRFREIQSNDRAERLKYVLSGEDPALTAWAMCNTQACPRCFLIVQRSDGCDHITCRCGAHFCYVCGDEYPLTKDHTGHENSAVPVLSAQGLVVIPAAPETADIPARCAPCAPAEDCAIEDDDMNGNDNHDVGDNNNRSNGSEMNTHHTSSVSAEVIRKRAQEMMTLLCPNRRCRRAVQMDDDFSECFALRCTACSASFCAWCLHIAATEEDSHTHVLDCNAAPAAMRGSSLYLQDGFGGPHLPPRPAHAFSTHWHGILSSRVEEMLRTAAITIGKKAAATILSQVTQSAKCTSTWRARPHA